MEINPIYKGEKIVTIQKLSEILNIEKSEIIRISQKADSFYIPNPQPKEDGATRMTYIVKSPLKQIQNRIKNSIFSYVEFPYYLMGGVSDKANPRDHIRNANVHAGKKWLINLDIKNYFSTIKYKHVYSIWKGMFGFSHEVSRILTKLTTFNGFLPQGSSTSSAIANLLLWDKEPCFVYTLEKRGCFYTRFVDDITISSTKPIDKKMISKTILDVKNLLKRYDLELKRKKTKFQTKSQNMTVNKVTVNKKNPTIPRKRRNNIRLAVYQFEKKVDGAKDWCEVDSDYSSLKGRLNYIKRLHPIYAEKLISKLEAKKGTLPTRITKIYDKFE